MPGLLCGCWGPRDCSGSPCNHESSLQLPPSGFETGSLTDPEDHWLPAPRLLLALPSQELDYKTGTHTLVWYSGLELGSSESLLLSCTD